MLKFYIFLLFFTCFIASQSLFAQKGSVKITDEVVQHHARRSFPLFAELLGLANDAHYPVDLEKNIQWCEKQFGARGFATQRLSTPTLPLLLAEKKAKNAKHTLLIYLQLDGQPVDSSRWQQENPWKATLKQKNASGGWEEIPYDRLQKDINPEWRIFARAASDAKGPVMMFVAALDAAKELGISPNYNMKIIMDFEEELGSPQLPQAVERYKNELKADAMLIFDGPRHISNQPTLSFGARGIATITLTVFGPRVAQHSGHYGNYVPNPALRLAQLLASMKDETGKVTIPGFYEGIEISETIKNTLAKVPDNEEEIRKKLGIAQPDKVAENYQLSLQYPSLNIRGLSAGGVGKAANTIIPATAIAELDVRLVLESDAQRLINLIKNHIEKQDYYIIDREPTDDERNKFDKIISFQPVIAYKAYRSDFDSKIGKWLQKSLFRTLGQPPLMIRTDGGSIPISPFVVTLGIPAVGVPTVNRDNNQHSHNENIRVGNYLEGIKTFLGILAEKFE